MSVTPTIADFANLLEGKRNDLARIQARIDVLHAERLAVMHAPPHTDDIIATLLRGVDQQAQIFQTQLTSRLAETFTGEGSADRTAPGKEFNILRLEAKRPDPEEVRTRAMRGQTEPDLNVSALVFFLRDIIVEQIPELVDKRCPKAREGMTGLIRATKLEGLNEAIATLTAERDALEAELNAARAAARR